MKKILCSVFFCCVVFLSAISQAAKPATGYNGVTSTAAYQEHQRVIDECTKALAQDPQDGAIYLKRGLAREDLADIKGAIADYNKAVEFAPDNADAYFARGALNCAAGNCAAAIKDLSKVIQLNPGFAAAYLKRGIAEFQLDKHNKKTALEDLYHAETMGDPLAEKAIELVRKAKIPPALPRVTETPNQK